ncbi:hypothetical protein CYLTODRAFT_447021 [Cylindrobasidium torrendii FP15055 ss-10]|uniref:FAD/NAD(P)-binding domain-containing protein n=1 Tax=Cylindrobasidium torrendii FP15055 ss-10 TaxID=1314674 RepID=A0A0D7AX24_9AGAR|nr:hypothetical protein CYLTODRAFT_447021 [Cylindrobasidium torrendii FP15055 ss-10]
MEGTSPFLYSTSSHLLTAMNTSATFWLLTIAVTLYYGSGLMWESLRRRLIAKYTTWYDASRLGHKRPDSAKIPGTAIICGGSLGGLFAARVCSDHFERVVIIESEGWLATEDGRRKDSWNQKNKRARVMQYNALHGFQHGLYQILRQAFGPKLLEECAARDIQVGEADFKYRHWGIPVKDARSYFGGKLPTILWAGRRGLETLLRHLTLDKTSYPNIEQIVGTVTGLTTDASRAGYLKGVSYRDAEGGNHDMDATLVLDCSGSAQVGVKWLKRIGLAQDLKKRTYDPKMQYITFEFTPSRELASQFPIPGGFDKEDGGIIINAPLASLDRRYLAMCRIDGHRSLWYNSLVLPMCLLKSFVVHICCGGWGSDIVIPRNIDDIINYVHSLQTVQPLPEWIYQTLELLRECEDSVVSKHVFFPAPSWTQYHTCSDLPSNFVALGDAVARLNPLYGQGTISSFAGGVCINSLLDTSRTKASLPPHFSRDFFNMQADKTILKWDGPKTNDYAYATTIPEEGESLASGAFLRKYMAEILHLCTEDAYINFLFLKNVALMDAAPIDLFHPRVVYRVLRRWVRTLVEDQST